MLHYLLVLYGWYYILPRICNTFSLLAIPTNTCIIEHMIKTKLDEALVILSEECGETVQAISKVLRFGMTDDNKQDLTYEIADILCMVDYLVENDYLSRDDLNLGVTYKEERLRIWSKLYV